MATQYARVTTPGADIDALCGDLEGEVNITDAVVVGHYERDGLTYPGSSADHGVVEILITGATDAAISAAITAVGSLTKVTNALASEDAET